MNPRLPIRVKKMEYKIPKYCLTGWKTILPSCPSQTWVSILHPSAIRFLLWRQPSVGKICLCPLVQAPVKLSVLCGPWWQSLLMRPEIEQTVGSFVVYARLSCIPWTHWSLTRWVVFADWSATRIIALWKFSVRFAEMVSGVHSSVCIQAVPLMQDRNPERTPIIGWKIPILKWSTRKRMKVKIFCVNWRRKVKFHPRKILMLSWRNYTTANISPMQKMRN